MVGFPAIALAAAVLIVDVVLWPASPIARALALSPLVAVGRVSYGLYLWHNAINAGLEPLGYSPAMALVRFGLAFLAAFLSYRYVGAPALRPKSRLRAAPFRPSGEARMSRAREQGAPGS